MTMLKCLLAAVGFSNSDIEQNKNKIIELIKQYSSSADILILGEAFLQGFYSLCFDYEKDQHIAIESDSAIIQEIADAARKNQVAVSFGFIEKEGNQIYSSQVTISADGEVIDVYRRVSPGWKEAFADEHYMEGTEFHLFEYKGKQIAIGTCGDFWFEENIESVKALHPDVVFWPVYTDFHYHFWNTSEKYAYARQVSGISPYVLYVNSVCLDKDEPEIAKGGAACFSEGMILSEVPAGREQLLLVEV